MQGKSDVEKGRHGEGETLFVSPRPNVFSCERFDQTCQVSILGRPTASALVLFVTAPLIQRSGCNPIDDFLMIADNYRQVTCQKRICRWIAGIHEQRFSLQCI